MKPCPRYKTTGLAWLPAVPEHWEATKIRTVFTERTTKVSDKEYPPLSVSKGGVVPQIETVAKSDDGDNRKLVRIGDFVINSRSDRKGSSGVSELDGSVSLVNLVLKPRKQGNGRFLHYLLKSDPFVEEFYRNGHGIVADLWTTRYSEMKNIYIPLPPPPEQERIVRYLDEKTAAIDDLVRAKEREIGLLRERKQAMVSAAVTGGAAGRGWEGRGGQEGGGTRGREREGFRDSGNPWLGKVPAGWKICRLKQLAKLKGGVGFPVEYQGTRNEEIPFIKVNALASKIEPTAPYDTISKATATKLHATIFKKGSIVFAKVGAALLLRRFEFLPFDCCIDNNMMAIFSISQDVNWFRYALSLLDFNLLVNPGAVPSVNQNQVGNMLLPVPPLAEQRRIVAHLDAVCSQIDAAETAIRKQIALLQEFRTRLVSDAVTGAVEVTKYGVETCKY